MEQDKLKLLLETVVHQIETGQMTSLDEIIVNMAQSFQEFMPTLGKELG